MKSCFKRFFSLVLFFCCISSSSLFANGGIPWSYVDGSSGKITLTNDKDLHLKKEDLKIIFQDDKALVICEYNIENTSDEEKKIDFAFNIPVKVSNDYSNYLSIYKIYDNGKAISHTSKCEILNDEPFGTEKIIWNLSKFSFEPKEIKQLKIVYRVRTNTDGRYCTATASDNNFKYNLFPATSFDNGIVDEFNLTIDKTDVLIHEGKITFIKGIDIENDNSKFVQKYSFKNFDLHKNTEIVINYDIRGYYVGTYIDDGFKRRFDATAASELHEGSIVYSAKNLGDHDYKTTWAEGAQDSGKNQIIHVFLSDDIAHGRPPFVAHTVTHLYLLNGFRRDEKTYYENNRVKKIKLTLWMDNTKKSFEITLPDRPYAEVNDYNIAYEADLLNTYLPLGRRGTIYDANWFDIEILEVYPGTKYNDTCISEIVILNVPQPYN